MGPIDAEVTSDGTLLDRHDAVALDLDGVVYRGEQVIPGALLALADIRRRGMPVVFLTNNSARTQGEVADRLTGMGIAARADEVLTSAVATASMLEGEGVPGTTAGRTAFVIGELGIKEALEGIGVQVVDGEPDRTDLVIVGWDRHVDYARLKTASLLVERGARLVATNPDASYPAAGGLWPGAGALLSVITTTTGAVPTVVGKPNRPMFDAAATMTGARWPLMVGDRLDTDIAGAAGAGWTSLLVLSGASRTEELPWARALPTYVAGDLSALLSTRTLARVRPASAGDLPGLRALLDAEGIASPGADGRLAGVVVAEDPVGSIAATACLERVDGHRYLRSVAVRHDLQGQGLGLLIASTALRDVEHAVRRPTYLVTADAAAFFERLGFRAIGPHGAADAGLPEPIAALAEAQGCAASSTAMVLDPPIARA